MKKVFIYSWSRNVFQECFDFVSPEPPKCRYSMKRRGRIRTYFCDPKICPEPEKHHPVKGSAA